MLPKLAASVNRAFASERHRYAIWCDPMIGSIGRIDSDGTHRSGKRSNVPLYESTRFSPGAEKERAAMGWDK